MQLVKNSGQFGACAENRRFIVNLTIFGDGQHVVRSCEIIGQSYRNRTSFHGHAGLTDVFVPDVAHGLKDCLSRLSLKTELVALPNFVLEMPGLMLADANMICTELEDGSINVIFRFKFFVGGINRIFREEIGFDDGLPEHTSGLSAQVLSDLAVPLLDLCAIAEQELSASNAHLGAFGKRLSQRSAEIGFQIELIKRFVEARGTRPSTKGRATPVQPRLKFDDETV